MLDDNQRLRYSKQLILNDIGVKGQEITSWQFLCQEKGEITEF